MEPENSSEKNKEFSQPKNIEILTTFTIDSYTDCYSMLQDLRRN